MKKQNLMSVEQAAEYLNVSVRTLNNWRSLGYPSIPYIKLGRSVKYRESDLDAYIEKNSHNVEAA